MGEKGKKQPNLGGDDHNIVRRQPNSSVRLPTCPSAARYFFTSRTEALALCVMCSEFRVRIELAFNAPFRSRNEWICSYAVHS